MGGLGGGLKGDAVHRGSGGGTHVVLVYRGFSEEGPVSFLIRATVPKGESVRMDVVVEWEWGWGGGRGV